MNRSVYSSQILEATQVPITWGMDEEDVGYVFNGIFFSHKNGTLPVAATQMEVGSRMPDKISQTNPRGFPLMWNFRNKNKGKKKSYLVCFLTMEKLTVTRGEGDGDR